MIHPLDILEIAEAVALFLSPHALTQCALVSRDWHQTFSPLLWHNCRLSGRVIKMEPHLSAAWRRYTPVIRQLRTHKEFLSQEELQGLDLPALHTLRISGHEIAGYNYSWDLVMPFLQRHLDRLQSLTLSYVPFPQIFETNPILTHLPDFGVAWGGYKRLTRLSLSNTPIDPAQWTDPVWDLLKGLESLTIMDSTLEDMDWIDFQKRLEGNRIQHLVFILNMAPKVSYIGRQWVEACPGLRSLQWWSLSKRSRVHTEEEEDREELDGSAVQFANGVSMGRWRWLNSLDLCFRRLQDQDIAKILAALQCGLESLSLDRTGFGPMATAALLYKVIKPVRIQVVTTEEPSLHRDTLEKLSVRHTSQVDSQTIQDFLCLLKNLKAFHASADLTDGVVREDHRPWACLGLVTLQLGLSLKAHGKRRSSPSDSSPSPSSSSSSSSSSPPKRFSKVLLKRLATLTQLEILVVGAQGRSSYREHLIQNVRHHSQPFRLQDGLDGLKTLTRLRAIQFGQSGQQLSVDEARWMVQHWPRLEIIDGKYRSESIVPPFKDWDAAWEIFKAHGVKNEAAIPGV